MRNLLKVFMKQFFGAKYEGLRKSIFIAAILFFAIYTAEIRMTVAPGVLFLTATVFTAGVMWQALNASKNAEYLQGIVVQPFENKTLVASYVLSSGFYTLVSKSLVVLVLFFAISSWSPAQIGLTILCAVNSCLFMNLLYVTRTIHGRVFLAVWGAVVLGAVVGPFGELVPGVVMVLSMLLLVFMLLQVDAYLFYQPVSAKKVFMGFGKKGSIFVYLCRYLLTNKVYLMNTAGLCAVACFLPVLLNTFKDVYMLPIGFAIISLNTPLCILLSSDPDLEQAVRVLPGQGFSFCRKYWMFLASVQMMICSVYLGSWQLQYGGVHVETIVTGIFFVATSTFLSVCLEWYYPIRNWKLESDLYHHPRKYLVPLVMVLIAGIFL